MDDDKAATGRRARSNFLRDVVDADLAAGRHSAVVTRFPPEPNGFMHIGHAKAIWVNYGIARDYGGRFRLRFDDTNPETEEAHYVAAIERDIAWLGCDWEPPTRHASDYFDFMYGAALTLVRKGLAYVDEQTQEQVAAGRGTIREPGTASPFRERPAAENLDLLARMKAGEFPDGSRVLRAKIDMAAPNLLLRDPILYRIRHARHHRTGDAWCIYPLYDFAHCLEDACEGVTHSFCSLEFETRRALYDWILDNALEGEALARRPHQYEFARLNLPYTVMSKRKFIRLVEERHVSGWDDPRLPTLAGLRRRGVTPEAIRDFCDMIGVARSNSVVDVGKLEYCLREDLSPRCPRVLCVLRPLEVLVTTWEEGVVEEIDAPYWPHDVPREGSRRIAFTRRIYVDRDDFREDPPKGWHRLAPGREVRLRHGYVIRVDGVEKDASGNAVRLLCSHDPATRSGHAPGRKVRGTVHWVSAEHSLPCEVRLYDRLFAVAEPGAERDFVLDLDPNSLVVVESARIETSMKDAAPGSRYQFERTGYFVVDEQDSAPGALVFNRIVTLRDTWAKVERKAARTAPERTELTGRTAAERPATAAEPAAPRTTIGEDRVRARAASAVLAAAFERYGTAFGISDEDADRLTGDEALVRFVDAALAVHPSGPAVAKWTVNELLRELKDRTASELPLGGAAFGRFVALAESDVLTAAAAKAVLATMIRDGGEADAIAAARGLRQMTDEDALAAIVEDVLAAHPDEVARYRAGKTSLLGFFMGQVMKASRGNAKPALVKPLLAARLDEASTS